MGRTSDAIGEGLSIAWAAARLTVRNHILVETIAHDEPFELDRFAPLRPADSRGAGRRAAGCADLVRRQRKAPGASHSDSHGTHDYRDRDVRNLRRRQKQYLGRREGPARPRERPGGGRRIGDRSPRRRVGGCRGQPRCADCASRGCDPSHDPDYATDARGPDAGAAARRPAAPARAHRRQLRRPPIRGPATRRVFSSSASAPFRARGRAPVAQWIEHLTTDQKVGGSSPFGRTLC